MFSKKQMMPLALASGLAALFTLVAAGAGLLLPGFYEPVMPAAYLAGAYAQDLIALPVAVALLVAITHARRGSVRAVLVWAACLGYLIYAYLLWTMDAAYTPLFPAYLAILSLSLFSLIGLLGQLDAARLRHFVADGVPARSTAAVLLLPALMAPPWIAFVLEGVRQGRPASINTVLVIDLAFIIPASLLTALLLWRRRTWGYIFAGIMLVKMTTMGLSLAIGSFWTGYLGGAVDPVWPLYAAFALVGGAALLRYMRYLGGSSAVGKQAVVAMD